MKTTEGEKIAVCLGIISPERNYSRGEKPGDATKVSDSASKEITKIEISPVIVNNKRYVIYKDNDGNYYREVNGEKSKITNYENRLKQRGIGDPTQTKTDTER